MLVCSGEKNTLAHAVLVESTAFRQSWGATLGGPLKSNGITWGDVGSVDMLPRSCAGMARIVRNDLGLDAADLLHDFILIVRRRVDGQDNPGLVVARVFYPGLSRQESGWVDRVSRAVADVAVEVCVAAVERDRIL